MTQFSILGPPRGGRRVKSEQEALAEAKSWAKPDNFAPVTPPGVTPSPVEVPGPGVVPVPSIVPAYFKVLGRFNVGDITKQCNYYVFHDLELPMGCWKELSLQGLFLPHEPKEFNDWSVVTSSGEPVGVMPADVRYGLMAVCFLKRAKWGFKWGVKRIVDEIHSGIWLPDSNTHFPHNATRIVYRANAPVLFSPGVGWSFTHPFGGLYEESLAGPDFKISKAAALTNPSYQSALEGFLGENDPERCRSVLEWSAGFIPAKLYREIKSNSGERAVCFGKNVGDTAINFNDYPGHIRPARAIRADKQNYIPK